MKSFLKWAGGKSRILPVLKKYLPSGKRFIEPFVGSGVVSLNVDYPSYLIADNNSDLISVWKYLSVDFVADCEKLFTPENNVREVFDSLKEEFNSLPIRDINYRKAVLFIYLNRHCFNGLCRYNSKSQFNVPFGKYDQPKFPKQEMLACLDKVKKFEIKLADFRDVFDGVEEGDVIYADPPYVPLSESANFDNYSAGGFGLSDHINLANHAHIAKLKGARVIISNHYNWTTKSLYSELGAKIVKLDVSRTISSNVKERKAVKELLAIF